MPPRLIQMLSCLGCRLTILSSLIVALPGWAIPADCDADGTEDSVQIAQGLSWDSDRNGILDGCEAELALFQLSYANETGTVIEPFSANAELHLRCLSPSDEAILWLNVRRGGEWVVRNLPLLPTACGDAPRSYVLTVPLGTQAGAQVQQADVQWKLGLEAVPEFIGGSVATLPVAQRTLVPPVDDVSTDFAGLALVSAPVGILATGVVGPLPPGQAGWNRDVPGIDEGKGECAPGAVTRCLRRLANLYCLPLPEADAALVAELATAFGTTPSRGTSYRGLDQKIREFLAAKKLGEFLEVEDCPYAHPTNMVKALQAGQEVILKLRGFTPATEDEGEKLTVGHVVMLTGATVGTNGNVTFQYRDDHTGGDQQGDAKPDGGSDKAGQVTFEPGNPIGLFSLSGRHFRYAGFIKIKPSPAAVTRRLFKGVFEAAPEQSGGVLPRLEKMIGGMPPTPADLANLRAEACALCDASRCLPHLLVAGGAWADRVADADALATDLQSFAKDLTAFTRGPSIAQLAPLRATLLPLGERIAELNRCAVSPDPCLAPRLHLGLRPVPRSGGWELVWPQPALLQVAPDLSGNWQAEPTGLNPFPLPSGLPDQYFRLLDPLPLTDNLRVVRLLEGACAGSLPPVLSVLQLPDGAFPVLPFDPIHAGPVVVIQNPGGQPCRVLVSGPGWKGPSPPSLPRFRWVDPRQGVIARQGAAAGASTGSTGRSDP